MAFFKKGGYEQPPTPKVKPPREPSGETVEELKERLDALTRENARLLFERDQYDARRREAEELRQENWKLMEAQGFTLFGDFPVLVDPSLSKDVVMLTTGSQVVYMNWRTGEIEGARDLCEEKVFEIRVPGEKKG